MTKYITISFTIASLIVGPLPAMAASDGSRKKIPPHDCKVSLVRELFKASNKEQFQSQREAFHAFFVNKETQGCDPKEFCDWLEAEMSNKSGKEFTCAEGGVACDGSPNCKRPEPPDEDLNRSVPPDVRREFRHVERRRPAPPPEDVAVRVQSTGGGGDGGSFLSSPIFLGLIGGALGGVLANSFMNRNQGPQYFQPPMGGPWNQFGGFRGPGVMPFGGAPLAVPMYGGNGLGAANAPYAIPISGAGSPWNGLNLPYASAYGAGGYGAGGYYGGAPAVLPLAPQSNFSVMGQIPQTHWNLLNAR